MAQTEGVLNGVGMSPFAVGDIWFCEPLEDLLEDFIGYIADSRTSR
ncbi:hypothetical protein PIIN_10383 [Serendipita indica DSM 11827]|uniref:Uncharacterized protein n=1 Tax=Serendipita indica (strain DSM 11827) TaxID=1109443 RepID=G4TYJ7_SERID|nr:hypothetical protein PIIN_10383 [Serendipita indica DSM 11827]